MTVKPCARTFGRSLKISLLCAAAATVLAGLTPSALAETLEPAIELEEAGEAESARRLETVTVQARKRDETLKDVPVTVTAIGGEQIANFELDTVTDLATRIPTMQIRVGGSGSGGSLSLRGVGSSPTSAAFDSAVLLDVDGVPVSTMRIVQNSFMDLEQVEILKGPQSLFFGKSASAGVLSFRSRNPGDTFEAEASASYEFEEKGKVFSGFISGPITDTFGARLAVRYFDADEVVKNTAPGVTNPYRGESSLDTRLTLNWEPTDRFSSNLKLSASRYENDGSSLQTDIFCNPDATGRTALPALAPGVSPDPRASTGFSAPSGLDCNAYDGVIQMGDLPAIFGGNIGGMGHVVPFTKSDLVTGRLALSYDLTDNLSIRSVTGYIDLDSDDHDGFSYDVHAFGAGYSRNKQNGWSQEIRLQSDFDSRFNFMVGAFYEDRETIFDTNQVTVGASGMSVPALGYSGGPDPVTGNTDDWRKAHTTNGKAFSIFASGDFDITDKLSLSAGLRYTEEEKSNVINILYMHSFLERIGFVRTGTEIGPIKFKDDNLSPEVSLVYELTPNINLFGAYKTGFKSGGIDNSALPSNSLAVAAATGDYDNMIYNSETSKGFEAGIKADALNGALRWNLTGYRYVFDDLQNQIFNAVAIAFVTSNAGEVTTQGLEGDFVWATDIEGLVLNGALAYTDSKYTDTYVQADDLNGRRTAAPEWSGNIGASYERPIGDHLTWRLSGFTNFSTEYVIGSASMNDPIEDGWATFDLSTSIGSPDGKWRLSLIGNNVTDERFATTNGGRPFSVPGTSGAVDHVRVLNRGRQVFLEARYKF